MWLSRLCCRPRSTLPRESSLTEQRWALGLPPPAPSSGRSQARPPPSISCASFSYLRDQDTSRKSRSIGKAIIWPLSVRTGRETIWFYIELPPVFFFFFFFLNFEARVRGKVLF